MTDNVELRSLLDRVRGRWFRQVALRTAGRAASAAAIPIVASLTIDYVLGLKGLPFVLLTLVAAAASLGLAGRVFWRMQRRPTDRQVARYVEERAAAAPGAESLDDALVSAVDVVDGAGDAELAAFQPLLVAAAVKRLRAIDAVDIMPSDAMRRAGLEAAVGSALLVVALALSLPSIARAVETAWVTMFPATIYIDLRPGDTRVVAGDPVRIRAVVRTTSGVLTRFPPSLVVSAGAQQRTVEMARRGDGFEFDFESVDRTFRYRASAGSTMSSEYTVTALFAPRVEQIDLRYQYPSFSGLPIRNEEDGGDIYAPAGTRVRVRIRTDKAARSGELAFSAGPPLALRPVGDRVLQGEVVLSAEGSYRVKLADADGLRSTGDTEYFIRLMDDRPPDVRIVRPSSDQQVTPLEEVAIEARADDDYGIAAFDLVYSVSGGIAHVVPFTRVTGTEVQKLGSFLLPVEDLGVAPGDVITYYARARDVGRGKRSTLARSDMFFLEVKPFGEEFVEAQSQAMSGGADARLESLIAAQKEIINATWHIERRSTVGRSSEDIRAIAEAQAELRARVEQMAGRGRRPGRGQPPLRIAADQQPPAARTGGDPIAAAAGAMAQAQKELESQRTREAIPHEMAALNGLLQAQAEVRRRQVAQQRAGAGGGGFNRSDQDLSALFDRELQRQQRTNYETRSQVEERPDQRESNDRALDRIRDLARRQEDLSRRQRELATANLPPEVLRRQLERLTREQMELRQRAEELSRQMNQQSNSQAHSSQPSGQQAGRQSQPQQGHNQAGGGSSAMRDASEQMRDAARDLQRQDTNGAAQSGERAAEQLRRLERQMREGSADGRQRAEAELQLEAQQIADAQRRIAAEAERLGRGGATAAGEARGRLAGEKERLADRVDELQRSARQLAQADAQGNDAGAIREALRELDQQQIGRRMRESAKEIRGGAQPGQSAEKEQQITRALETVVDKLGGNAAADTRRLSDELTRSREMRDRLNRLERRIRDAELTQRAAGGDSQTERGQPARQGSAGRQGRNSSQQTSGDLQRLREEYARELEKTRAVLDRLTEGQRRDSRGGSTPEHHEFSRSAPGTESFKQDRSAWEALRKDVDSALDQYEAAVSDRLARKLAEDRLSAGGSERVPEGYSPLIAKYYQSLATKAKSDK